MEAYTLLRQTWNMELMFTRKITFRTDQSKVQGLIQAFLTECYTPECPEGQLLADSETLPFYFQNLHQHITCHNLVCVKKYENLHDGLYVLLKGQISFLYQGGNIDNQKDGQKMKSSVFKSLPGSLLISQTFSVFECSLKNCTSIEDSFLLRIKEEQSLNAKFYEYYNQRKQLYDYHYLDSIHQQLLNTEESSGIFTTDMRVHSNFVFKNYAFRQVISPDSIAIIAHGKVKVSERKSNGHDIERYGILLPNFSYEVTSSSVQVMQVLDNESLKIKINIEAMKQHHRKHLPGILKQNKIMNRGHQRKGSTNFETSFRSKEKDKRQKEIIKLSKESENYSIISSFLCQKNLSFVKNQSLSTKQRQKKQERCKNPLVLFNIVNEKSKIATPNFVNAETTPSLNKRSVHFKSEKRFDVEQKQKSSSPNINILRKLRLPLKDYQKMVKRQQTGVLRSQAKAKSLFTLTAGIAQVEGQADQDEQFIRYNE